MIKGLGTDIVEHDRINLKIAKKILTKTEYHEFNQVSNKIEYLASRFAVKEAIIKASNCGYRFQEIEIFNAKNGQPQTNIKNMHISISHEQKYSVAVAILEEI